MNWGHWCSVLCVWGMVSTAGAASYLPGNSYLLIDDGNLASVVKASMGTTKSKTVNLLSWAQIQQAPPHPAEKYQRERHFGFWLDYENDDTCLDTRGLLLLNTSLVDPEVTEKPCRVAKGEWYDPYTNDHYYDATDVQIDHTVPLKNAYISGAFAWTWKKRCAYFNFLANDSHLKVVQREANLKKLDRGPEDWMPTNTAYTCTYLADWLKVKAIWRLMLSEKEAQAIAKHIKTAKCPASVFTVSKSELQKQRQQIAETENFCPADPPTMNRIIELRRTQEL